MSSADDFWKQFGPRSGLTEHLTRSGYMLFDTLMLFLNEYFEKVKLKISADDEKNHLNLPSMQRVKPDIVLTCAMYCPNSCTNNI